MKRWVLLLAVVGLVLSACGVDIPEPTDRDKSVVPTAVQTYTDSAFPMTSPEGLVVQRLTADSDGTAVLTVYNPGPRGLSFGMLAVQVGIKKLYFFVNWLPAGGRVQVAEFTKTPLPEGNATAFSCLQTRWDWFSLGEGEIALTRIGDSLTVENVSGEGLPGVTLYCRRGEEGIAQPLCVLPLSAGQSRTVALAEDMTIVAVVFDGG